jgi:ribonuclease P protein component
MSVVALPDPGLAPPRVAFRLGRRFGTAVVRNRFRRRVQALLRDPLTRVDLAPGAYLVGARPEAATLSPAELRTQIERVFAAVPRTVAP